MTLVNFSIIQKFIYQNKFKKIYFYEQKKEYPSELTTIQKWRLIGNSLNVLTVAILIKLMTK
jgi:hypothetical protein